MLALGPFHWRVFHPNLDVMQIPFCFNPNSYELIATTLCTCHGSCEKKCCSNQCIRIWMRLKLIFIEIQLWVKNYLWNGLLSAIVFVPRWLISAYSGEIKAQWRVSGPGGAAVPRSGKLPHTPAHHHAKIGRGLPRCHLMNHAAV